MRDGSYRVFADDPGGTFDPRYYGVPDSVANGTDATQVTIEGGNVAGIDIRLGSKAQTGISGTVRSPEGQPVGGVTIAANGPVAFGQASSGADGTFRVAGLPSGDYQLFVEPTSGSEFFSGPYVAGSVGSPGMDPTLVTVGATDATGVNIALVRGRTISGRVTLSRQATIRIVAFGPGFGEAIADANGFFAIKGLVPGAYQLIFNDFVPGPEQTENGGFPYGAFGPGGTLVPQDQAASIDVTDADATLPPVHLPRGTDIVGLVTDGRVGLANPFLFVCDESGMLGCAAATGAANGTFRILHVPSGKFTIFASIPGRVFGYYQPDGFTIDQAAAGTVKVVSGKPDVKGIKVVLPAGGTVTGRITGPNGTPIVGATIAPTSLGIAPNAPQPRSGADGRYRVTGIPSNEYGLYVIAPEGSDYLSGYYMTGAPGNYTADFSLATKFRVVEEHDRQAPSITFRDPAAGATGASVAAAISVRFSEPVDGVTATTMQLRDPRGRLVAATVSFGTGDRTARLIPSAQLDPGTRYRLSLSSAIRDWSGNRLHETSWTFQTSP